MLNEIGKAADHIDMSTCQGTRRINKCTIAHFDAFAIKLEMIRAANGRHSV
ncbi:hypothetical protein D3C80_1848730 [compost metagenome]